MFFAPGSRWPCSSGASFPARANVSAAAAPAGPAPTTIASKAAGGVPSRLPPVASPVVGLTATSGTAALLCLAGGVRRLEPTGELDEQRAGVGDEGEVGHRHHRGTRVGVDRDDGVRVAEPTDVLQ